MRRPDLSYLKAATIVVREHQGVRLVLVGCGGTGSFVARSVCQVARVLLDMGREVRVTFVDPDIVEPGNVPRQNFCEAEVGTPKAEALARRFAAAWGLEIEVVPRAFEPKLIDDGLRHDRVTVLMGCVDNAAARRALDACLDRGRHQTSRGSGAPGVFWIDAGNSADAGQVLLGTTSDRRTLARGCGIDGFFTEAPAPTLQAPELLVPRVDERPHARLSCAELMALNLQALSVNARVAAEAGDMLMRLLVTHDLKRFATNFDLPSGTSRSVYLTSEALARFAPPGGKKRGLRRAS